MCKFVVISGFSNHKQILQKKNNNNNDTLKKNYIPFSEIKQGL